MNKETRYAVELFTASIVFFICPVFYLIFLRKYKHLSKCETTYPRQELFYSARVIMLASIIIWACSAIYVIASWMLQVNYALGI